MEETVAYLVDKAWGKQTPQEEHPSPRLYTPLDPSRRLLLALAGIPGSGKTTMAGLLASSLNERHRSCTEPSQSSVDDVALVVPLDGYHLTRQQLSRLPNSEEALFRRGAAFTFDGESYLQLVRSLREPLKTTTTTTTSPSPSPLPSSSSNINTNTNTYTYTNTIHAPSFDHATKDPIANDIAIPATARILIFEGLYVALSRPPWSEAASLMDEIWFMDVPLPVAEARVAKRNFAAGLSPTLEAALSRTRKNDMRNAHDVLENRVGGGLIRESVRSVEDQDWKSDGLKGVERDLEEQQQQQHQQQRAREAEAEFFHQGRPSEAGQQGERKDSIAELVASGAGL